MFETFRSRNIQFWKFDWTHRNSAYFDNFIMMRTFARFEENLEYFVLITVLLFSFKTWKNYFNCRIFSQHIYKHLLQWFTPPPAPKPSIFVDFRTCLNYCAFFKIAHICVGLQYILILSAILSIFERIQSTSETHSLKTKANWNVKHKLKCKLDF